MRRRYGGTRPQRDDGDEPGPPDSESGAIPEDRNERAVETPRASPSGDLVRERTILVGVDLPIRFGEQLGGPADTEELGLLVDTAGGDVVGEAVQKRDRPDPATFIGKGKLAELKREVDRLGAVLVVFDNELTPAQGRDLEKALEIRVIDRTELILDIFARHARTRQARLQVELAQLQYALPRLKRLWSHLERQAAGIGTRGPGETQLETDRRLIDRRIAHLKRELAEIARERQVQRQGRSGMFTAALVGYTNAGKSTLMNGLTQAEVLVEDRLFATLDATTRRVELDERRRFLLTDTVGFIRRLPHHLVESFRATLQEVADADLLVHVVDAASPDPQRQIDAVNRVLAEIVDDGKPVQLVFNKLDLVDGEQFVNRFSRLFPEALFVSALAPEGAAKVREAIASRLLGLEHVYELTIPGEHAGLVAVFHRTGAVLKQEWKDDHCRLVVRMREEEQRRLAAGHPEILWGGQS